MNIGMLWFDNDPKRDFVSKVSRAAAFYHQKYGQTPNICFVHPKMLPATGEQLFNDGEQKKFMAGTVEVRPAPSVLPNHFWIGVNGTN